MPGLTKKQSACSHPVRYVHLAIDPRWETCALCHIVRRAPIPAPWIVAYDAAQPTPPPPPLFADLADLATDPEPER